MRAEAGSDAHTIDTRLEAAAEAWGSFWNSGNLYDARHVEPLMTVTGNDIAKVLRRQGNGKALGVDGGGARELLALPHRWLKQLGHFMGEWEAAGRCPGTLRQVIYAVIPQPEATAESQLRPIGLPPYVYRVWMAMRK